MSAPTISRRTIAKGAAWSVPAVTIAAAAPAMATSPLCDPATNIKNATVLYTDRTDNDKTSAFEGDATYTFTVVDGVLPKGTQVIIGYNITYPSNVSPTITSTTASNVVTTHTTAPLDEDNTIDKYTQTMTLDQPIEVNQPVSMYFKYTFPSDTEGYVTSNVNSYAYPDQSIVGECETTIVSFKRATNADDSE